MANEDATNLFEGPISDAERIDLRRKPVVNRVTPSSQKEDVSHKSSKDYEQTLRQSKRWALFGIIWNMTGQKKMSLPGHVTIKPILTAANILSTQEYDLDQGCP